MKERPGKRVSPVSHHTGPMPPPDPRPTIDSSSMLRRQPRIELKTGASLLGADTCPASHYAQPR